MERIPLNCYQDDWLLLNVLLYDSQKNIALLDKSGDCHSFELIDLNCLKQIFSQKVSEERQVYSQSVSLDLKYYIDYYCLNGNCESEGEEEKGQEIVRKMIFNKIND